MANNRKLPIGPTGPSVADIFLFFLGVDVAEFGFLVGYSHQAFADAQMEGAWIEFFAVGFPPIGIAVRALRPDESVAFWLPFIPPPVVLNPYYLVEWMACAQGLFLILMAIYYWPEVSTFLIYIGELLVYFIHCIFFGVFFGPAAESMVEFP